MEKIDASNITTCTDTKVPYIVHESITTKLERTIEKLWILNIILIILLVGTNAAWIYYENQFEDTVISQEVQTDEGDATVTGIGDIINGTGETNSKETTP